MATNDDEVYNEESLEVLKQYLKPKNNNVDNVTEDINRRITNLCRIIDEITKRSDKGGYLTQPRE